MPWIATQVVPWKPHVHSFLYRTWHSLQWCEVSGNTISLVFSSSQSMLTHPCGRRVGQDSTALMLSDSVPMIFVYLCNVGTWHIWAATKSVSMRTSSHVPATTRAMERHIHSEEYCLQSTAVFQVQVVIMCAALSEGLTDWVCSFYPWKQKLRRWATGLDNQFPAGS